MSLYNMINGVNPCAFFFLPMLGKHPDEYPRFRDCFLRDPDRPQYHDHIHVYTRVGGGNRDEYEEDIAELRAMPTFVTDHDDDFDSTYATFVFKVPDQWRADFDTLLAGKDGDGSVPKISTEYKAELIRVYPKLTDKINELFP